VNRLAARLNLVAALPAEAKVLNQILKLQRIQPDRELPLYANAGVALVISGPGMQAAMRGVRFLRQRNAMARASWLNIGIAGHADLSLGQAVMASRVIGPQPGHDWELQPLASPGCRSLPVCTTDEPVTDYPSAWAYDMEAAGFVTTAQQAAPLNRIQVLKVISDNRHHPTGEINAKMIKELLQMHTSLIRQLVHRMQAYVPTPTP
jgi:hypothetical protein